MTKVGYRHAIFFVYLLFSFLNQHAQSFMIKGEFPGQNGKKLFITYMLTGAGKSGGSTDSCIIDEKGEFGFKVGYKEPVSAILFFDFDNGLEFLTDRETVFVKVKDKTQPFSFSNTVVISSVNTEFEKYRHFICPEKEYADSLYKLREKYRAGKKRDLMKGLEPDLIVADSLLLRKNFDYAVNPENNHFIRAMVLYRKRVFLNYPVSEITAVYQNLSSEAQQSIYGRAINEFLISKSILKPGELAPAFKNQVNPDGKPVLLEKFKGKCLLIDFWAAWCIPCREEIPSLITLYQKFKSEKFEILGISLDRKRDDWIKAISKDKIPWLQASDLKFWDSEVVKLYGIYGIPFNVLVNGEGKIAGINLHGKELEEMLSQILKQ